MFHQKHWQYSEVSSRDMLTTRDTSTEQTSFIFRSGEGLFGMKGEIVVKVRRQGSKMAIFRRSEPVSPANGV
jgi:hypothetical protein